MQFCTTKCPQFCEFEAASSRNCRLRSKMAFLEVAKNDEACAVKVGSLHADLTPPNTNNL